MTRHRDGAEWTQRQAIDLIADENVSYSFAQDGCDLLLAEVFGDRPDGYYVSVGARHSRRGSNTFLLHRVLGWRGANLVASEEIRDQFMQDRPVDLTVLLGPAWREVDRFAAALADHLAPAETVDLLDLAEVPDEGLGAFDWLRLRPRLVTIAGTGELGRAPFEAAGYALLAERPGRRMLAAPDFVPARLPAAADRPPSIARQALAGAMAVTRRLLVDAELLRAEAKPLKAVRVEYERSRRRAEANEAALIAARSEVDRLAREIRRLEKLVEAAQAERTETASGLAEARRRTEKLRIQLGEVSAERDAIRGSVVWRLSAPFHRIEREVRRWHARRTDADGPKSPKAKPVSRPVAAVPRPDHEALRVAYRALSIATEPETFVLYRIVGNDLAPRHVQGQSLTNVSFILANEPPLQDCDKRWIVNRIFDPRSEAAIIDLLERHRQPYLRIPFDTDDYARVGWAVEDFKEPGFLLSRAFERLGEGTRRRAEMQARRLKNNYVMNNNGARNTALADGRRRAKWVLPWDGNCFVTAAAWQAIRSAVLADPHVPYFVVPMSRSRSNAELSDPGFVPAPVDEPQIVFRRDAGESFDERQPYGRRPKVELLWRLGVPGPWDEWTFEPWDLPRRGLSPEAGQFASAGWVARLASGVPELDVAKASFRHRGNARANAIVATLDMLDRMVVVRGLDPERLTFYDEAAIAGLAHTAPDSPIALRLRRDADEAVSRGPYSVIDKTTLAPSGDPHDYWHPAPYWWPNPETPDGLPYVLRDGERAPGTALFDPESGRFDRTRLQLLFDDTTILALAQRAFGKARYGEHAAALVRRWFVDPSTAMNPHLRYAQVRLGHDGNEGNRTGVIEMKDIYFFLDAVRLLADDGALGAADLAALRTWLRNYAKWLETSQQGRDESRAANNHGTMFDLQTATIGAWLGDADMLIAAVRRAQVRLHAQFDAEGAQPEELARTNTRHYCCFNLQAWTSLARVLSTCGEDLWSRTTSDGRGLGRALAWIRSTLGRGEWPYPDISTFDVSRLQPLLADYRHHYAPDSDHDGAAVEFRHHPDAGIAPYWTLARR